MGRVYEIKFPEALTWSQHFFAVIRTIRIIFKRVQLINKIDNNHLSVSNTKAASAYFDDYLLVWCNTCNNKVLDTQHAYVQVSLVH